ncbi:hypothetical protein [Fibrella forsythiae]|uniref:Transposase n=1 Tax=Fibrella forsythiae TaxID=2817061 RepID=A0ABS3JAF6_9BACT|nr:hypothetical protein [Fibrella forsythiae]MBO0946985.1 hypothetical protein [Fibrella forsythiae]
MRKSQLCAELSATEKPITYNTMRDWFKRAGLYDQIPDLNRRRILTPKEVELIRSRLN